MLRILGGAPALVLVVVGLGELWSATHYEDRAVQSEDWTRAQDILRERHRPGELIVVAPSWLDPLGRHYFGEWIPVDMAARMDSARYPVIWEISARGHRAPEGRGLRVESSWQLGRLEVRRLSQEPAALQFDFTDRIAEAAIRGRAVGRPSLSLEEVGFEPHRCIRVEPRPGQEVELRYSSARLGTQLVVFVGLADIFTRRDIREPADLRVEINGTVAARKRVGIDDGWAPLVIDTQPAESAEVTFVVGAAVSRRLVCFAAEARK